MGKSALSVRIDGIACRCMYSSPTPSSTHFPHHRRGMEGTVAPEGGRGQVTRHHIFDAASSLAKADGRIRFPLSSLDELQVPQLASQWSSSLTLQEQYLAH